MSSIAVAGISILAVTILSLTIIIIKSVFLPKKADNLPKLLKQGHTQNVIKLAKKILIKNPKDYNAHYYLGKAYLKDNKSELAILEYRFVNDNAVFGHGINEIEFRKEFGTILLKHHQGAEALKNYLLLTQLEPQNADNYFQVGTLYKEAGRNDTAIGYIKKTLSIDKRHAKAHAELGLMYYKLKQFSEAQKEIDTAIKLSPDTYSSYYYLGKIQKDNKDILSAIKSFEKAQRDPDLKIKAIIEHGSCFMTANRIENAVVDFQRAIELDSTNSNPETLYARYFLAACYEKNRKFDQAIEQWDSIYQKNKNFKDVASKLSEYKDLHANDFLKDYLTGSNESFLAICKNAADKGLKLEVLSCELKRWGCAITAVDKREENWMAIRKQVSIVLFYREPNPIEDKKIIEALDSLKTTNSSKSLILSSSGFSITAKRYAECRPIELYDKTKLEAILTAAGQK